MVEVTGPRGTSLGFFVQIDNPNPNSEYVVTTYSAVGGGDQIEVSQPEDGSRSGSQARSGHIFGVDRDLELAIVELPGRSSTSLEFASMSGVSIGDPIFAVGCPQVGASSDLVSQGSIETALLRHPGEAFIRRKTFQWPTPEGKTFRAGAPNVNSSGQVLGFVAAPPSRGISGEGQPITVSLYPSLIEKSIDRLRNRSSVLEVSPENRIAGREVSFALKIQPYQIVRQAHLNPEGEEVAWIFPNGSTRKEKDVLVTRKMHRADASGTVSWTRTGAFHVSGQWTLRAVFDPLTRTADVVDFPYEMTELEVEGKGQVYLGLNMNSISNPDFTTYYSDSVPSALAMDIASRLYLLGETLPDTWNVSRESLPDLYITASLEGYNNLESHLRGRERNSQSAFYQYSCRRCPRDRPGIVIPLERHRYAPRRHLMLTHEYGHALFHEISPGRQHGAYAAWINEGLAEWSKYRVGLEGMGQEETYRSQRRQISIAQSNASGKTLFPLSSLESGEEWGERTGEKRALQYSQAYMTIRYLVETYSLPSIISLVRNMGNHATVGEAIELELGVTYSQLETDSVS